MSQGPAAPRMHIWRTGGAAWSSWEDLGVDHVGSSIRLHHTEQRRRLRPWNRHDLATGLRAACGRHVDDSGGVLVAPVVVSPGPGNMNVFVAGGGSHVLHVDNGGA